MKLIGVFFWMFFSVVSAGLPALSALRFATAPAVRRFADGAFEWSASVSCVDPTLLQGARVAFWLDTKLEGPGEAAGSAALSPADCEDGALPLQREFFPPASILPAVLRAEVRSAQDSVTDARALLSGGLGSLLALPRFCAGPKNGEPEWIEVRNVSLAPVSLAKVRLEGRTISVLSSVTSSPDSNVLGPGESFTAVAAGDTAELRLWQPGARVVALSSWPSLRNSGDTLRLSLEDGAPALLILDSLFYGTAGSAREDCASVPREESASAAHGFGLEGGTAARAAEGKTWGRWKRSEGPWIVTVTAPAGGRYDVRLYDVDGLELAVLARDAVGPRSFSLDFPQVFPGASPRAGAVIVHLQPHAAPPVRRLLWIVP